MHIYILCVSMYLSYHITYTHARGPGPPPPPGQSPRSPGAALSDKVANINNTKKKKKSNKSNTNK